MNIKSNNRLRRRLNESISVSKIQSARQIANMDFDSLKNQVSNLTLYDVKAGVRKVQNGMHVHLHRWNEN